MSMNTNPELFDSVSYEPLTEPVTAPCGHSFNLNTYRTLVSSYSTTGPQCPICRAPISRQPPAVNITLREMVARALTPSASSSVSSCPSVAGRMDFRAKDPITLTATKSTTGNRIRLSFNTTDDPTKTMPTLFYDILDNSGSMGSPSTATSIAGSDASRLSRSALVRHSVATQIELTRPDDMLAICLFDTSTSIVLPPTRMDAAGKARAKQALPLIRPCGGTNIWNAIMTVLENIKAVPPPPDYNVCILFQTDGESDPQFNPMRGIPAALRSWLDTNPAIAASLTIHTIGYGFGSALDMPLLKDIAEIGGGSVNYVPDGGMVGTVFIHLMVYLMTCHYRKLTATLRASNSTRVTTVLPIGFLQGGQSRDFLVDAESPFEVTVQDSTFRVDPAAIPVADDGFYVARNILLSRITDRLAAGRLNVDDTFAAIAEQMTPTDSGGITALLTDVRDPSSDKGQVGKAFEPDNLTRWGRHFLAGFISGLKDQRAINFRDQTSKLFGSPSITAAITRGEEIFMRLEPPKEDVSSVYPSASSSAPINMSSLMSSSGPCFTDGLVRMADGSERDVSQIYAGDVVEGGHIVRCRLKTIINGTPTIRLGSGGRAGFTIYHPVMIGDRWEHPCNLGPTVLSNAKALYNFVLQSGHILRINGVRTCTMGHDFTGDPVIEHAYFGKRVAGVPNILDDLAASPGFAQGDITWANVRAEHHPVTGVITRLIPQAPF